MSRFYQATKGKRVYVTINTVTSSVKVFTSKIKANEYVAQFCSTLTATKYNSIKNEEGLLHTVFDDSPTKMLYVTMKYIE